MREAARPAPALAARRLLSSTPYLPPPMLEMFLWSLLFGGLPAIGYYLFKYGHALHARGRALRQKAADADQNEAQWRSELVFAVSCCVWAGSGLLVCHLLQAVSQVQ